MGNFNRGRSGGGFRSRPSFGGRPKFGDRGDRGPVEMHQAICDNCGKDCQVPFRPTSGKPVFCSSCFENNRGSDSRGSEGRNFERPTNFEERLMFDAICDNCGNSCKVPFQPRGDKPIYCSNCFGEKKGVGNRENGQSQPQYKTSLLFHNKTSLLSNNKEQFEALSNKLDRILQLLDQQPQEQVVAAEETKVVKKRSSKKS